MNQVLEFHHAYGLLIEDEPIDFSALDEGQRFVIGEIGEAIADLARELHAHAAEGNGNVWFLRLQLLVEEVGEVLEAVANIDQPNLLQELCDVQYVLNGMLISLGMHGVFTEAFATVHASNMSKLDDDGKPILNEAGRVVKGPNYFKPDMKVFFNWRTCPACGCLEGEAPTYEGGTFYLDCPKCGNEWQRMIAIEDYQ